MESWKEFRKRTSIEIDAQLLLIKRIRKWCDEYKWDVVRHEPPDAISKGKFMAIDDLLEKLETMV